MGNSRESPSRSKNDSSLRMKLWKRSSPILSPLVASRLLVFTEIAGCDRAGERGTGMEQVKPQSSPFLLRFTHFSSKSTYWIAARLVNFQSSGKVNFKSFYKFFHCFHDRTDFQRLSVFHFSDATSTFFIKQVVYLVGLKPNFVSYVSRSLSSTLLALDGLNRIYSIHAQFKVSQGFGSLHTECGA